MKNKGKDHMYYHVKYTRLNFKNALSNNFKIPRLQIMNFKPETNYNFEICITCERIYSKR